MELISVIVPVFNAEKYLSRCIQSLIEQTYYNIEIILIDDGSTDFSSDLCDEWAYKDQRIKVIHKDNGGVSSARNVGLDNVSGDYVFFCDADDAVTNTCLELLLKCQKKYHSDISFGLFKMVRDSEDFHIDQSCEKNKKDFVIDNQSFFSLNHFSYGIWGSGPPQPGLSQRA